MNDLYPLVVDLDGQTCPVQLNTVFGFNESPCHNNFRKRNNILFRRDDTNNDLQSSPSTSFFSVIRKKTNLKKHRQNVSDVDESHNKQVSSFATTDLPTFQDRYVLTRVISKSNRSTICACICRETREQYCVKVLNENCCSMDVSNNELWILLSSECLNQHENIVPVREILVDHTLIPFERNENTGDYDFVPSFPNNNVRITPIRTSSSCDLTTSQVYIVMKYVNGGNLLSHILHNNPINQSSAESSHAVGSKSTSSYRLKETRTKKLIVQLLRALKHLHEKCNIVHGSLDPSNLLLEKEDDLFDDSNRSRSGSIRLVVTDFGLSRSFNHDAMYRTEMRNSGTGQDKRFEMLRNPDYSAPEVQNNRNRRLTYDNMDLFMREQAAMDMWSVGSIAFFMLAGHAPSEQHWNDSRELLGNGRKCGIKYPGYFSRFARKFISNCLREDPSVRMTASEALNHIWLLDEVKTINRMPIMEPLHVKRPFQKNQEAHVATMHEPCGIPTHHQDPNHDKKKSIVKFNVFVKMSASIKKKKCGNEIRRNDPDVTLNEEEDDDDDSEQAHR